MKSFLFLCTLLFSPVCLTAAEAHESDSAGKPMVYMVSNAHFDTQWRWTVQTSIDSYLYSTLVQNFALFDEYPEYVFNFEGAVKYAWAKEYYPELYAKLKKYIKDGRWHVSGASWDATDPNMPSIESFIRNIMLGQRFYREEFGVLSTDIMLPDCFGFGIQLPSVAAHCGLIGFGTQKLAWRQKPFHPNGMKYPFHFGIWKGLDGSKVMAVMDGGNYAWSPSEPVTDWPGIKNVFGYFSDIPAIYRYFGTGDRGGSATPTGVRYIDEAIHNPGPDYNLKFATSDDMFKDFLWDKRLPEYSGELLMDVHATGCYTSKAQMKNLNRRNEWLLGSAETVSAVSDFFGGISYPHYTIDNGWKRVIWHQFHDDLTGTSIPEAYQFSYNDEYITVRQMNAVVESAVKSVSSVLDTRAKGVPVVVYNPISAENKGIVTVRMEIPEGCRSVEVFAPSGRKVKSQIVGREGNVVDVAFAGADPSLSLSAYDFRPSAKAEITSSALKVTAKGIENKIYRLCLNADGDICSILDKRCGRELVRKGEAFSLSFFDDNASTQWPSWEIMKGVMDRQPSAVNDDVKISVSKNGPLMASVRIERKHAGSTFVQEVVLTDGAADDRIDILNDVNWQSKASLLKASFPVSFDAPQAEYDMGMGHIARGNNTDIAYEVFAHQWADMTASDGSYGVTIINNNKYGWDKPDDHTLRLTLLHTPDGDNGFTEQSSQDLGRHSFTYSIVGHPGALVPSKADIDADCLNQGKFAYVAESHQGNLGKSFSIAGTSNPSLRIKAFKKAQDGDGFVVRVYEISGKGAEGNVIFNSAISDAEELNGIEDKIGEATFIGKSLEVKSSPFALKTFRVRLAEPAVRITSPEYEALAIPYNIVAITTDNFTTQGRLGREHKSFAAEILPKKLEFKGIPFEFGSPDYRNGLLCDSQKLSLKEGTRTVHLLVTGNKLDEACEVEFRVGGKTFRHNVSGYSGLYGCYGWPGYYGSNLRNDDLAYVGTHTHHPEKGNESYVFTYMYLLSIPVDGASEIEMPAGKSIVLLSATAEM